MSTNTIPVIKFLFREELRVLGDALNIAPGFNTEEFSNSNDLSTYLSTVPAGLIVTSLYDRNDLIQIATFMKLGKKIAKDCTMKIVVFNFSKDRNFEKAIAKLGILDLVEPNINTKALKFKIDFWMKSLNAQVKNSAVNTQKVKSLEQTKAQEKKTTDVSGINWLEPLELEEDIWLLKNDSDCKKVLSKWLIRLLGPSPYIGQWTELKTNLWRFDIKESEKEIFVPGEGAWFFTGDHKPDFVWKENVWLISGDNFDLSFRNSSESFSRLNCKNRVIQVCKNSLYARTKESAIIDSFDKEMVFKREAENLEDLEGKGHTDLIENGNLEGKNKTEEIDGGPLQGKSKSGADRSNNLTGKTKGQEAITHGNLEQEISTDREKTHWNNKNTYEEESKSGELSVNSEKHRDGVNLEQKNKNQDHQKYYKNHNEAETYEAGELGQGLHGKSSTDKLASHYGRPSPSAETREAVEKAEKALTEAKTPEAREKAERNLAEAKSKAEKEIRDIEEKNAKNPSGKSSTDKLASHYGGVVAQESAKNKEAKEAIERAEKALSEAKTPEARDKAEKALREAKERAGDLPELSPRDLFDRVRKPSEAQPERSVKTEMASSLKDERTKSADIFPLDKAREERNKQKTPEEKTLDKLTEDAKVISLMTFQGRQISCGLDDFFEDTVIFQTEDQGIETSSDVKLDLKFKFLGKDTNLNIAGNVITIDDDGAGRNFVSVRLSKENASAFESFMKLYEIRQQNVNEFMKKAKGL